MPKRTNDFQTLIKHIYDQIVPAGGVVTESGMLRDKDSGELREVGILVSYKYAGHEFSFIVECRDHTRPQCVEWIDSLIGKSKSLEVAGAKTKCNILYERMLHGKKIQTHHLG